jgi:DNA-binding response OmpR family regulator
MTTHQTVPREQVLMAGDDGWDAAADPMSNVVDVVVKRLRRKLGAERIETARGSGYRLPSPSIIFSRIIR